MTSRAIANKPSISRWAVYAGSVPLPEPNTGKRSRHANAWNISKKNLSEFAGRFGVDGSGLARQLRTHYPGVLERREAERLRLGYDDRLPRGSRRCCREQYADAVELLRADRYVTVREAAESCGVSCSGLEQHLLFYHKELVARRIGIRKQAVGQQRKGEITGRGSTHAPSPAIVQKYAEALRLYRTTPQSAARIARQTNVSKKGFYAYLQKVAQGVDLRAKEYPLRGGAPGGLVENTQIQPRDESQIRRRDPTFERE